MNIIGQKTRIEQCTYFTCSQLEQQHPCIITPYFIPKQTASPGIAGNKPTHILLQNNPNVSQSHWLIPIHTFTLQHFLCNCLFFLKPQEDPTLKWGLTRPAMTETYMPIQTPSAENRSGLYSSVGLQC